jgi:SNF2 family DNA or RNA helicase
MSADDKEAALRGFAEGSVRVLITKPSIAGFGLNWQHCARMAFVGVTDSWESYYQAIRRCWRFGQLRDVLVYIFSSAAEGAVIHNLARKDRDSAAMADALSRETRDIVRSELRALSRESNAYNASREIKIPNWLKSED